MPGKNRECVVEILMQVITFYEVRVKPYALEDKDIAFDRILTKDIRHKLQIQQYNSNRDKVELAPYNNVIENHEATLIKQHNR